MEGLEDLKKLYDIDKGIHFGFLQPMSGISTSEDKLTTGSINRKLGEGKTAEVIRNICFEVLYPETVRKNNTHTTPEEKWKSLCGIMKSMFSIDLHTPKYIKPTGFIQLKYTENKITYDVSSAGRGLQQVLLLFAYMYANPQTIFLLDEPDAHLEIIRQKQVFSRIE